MTEHYKHKVKSILDLIPYVNNSRTHSEEQINQIAASIKEFGFTSPILIDEQGGVIAGHGRIMAAKKLGLTDAPCIVLEGLTEAQKKAYVIADNQLPMNAEWDLDKLKLEIENLEELDFDISLLGFDDDFLNSIFENIVDSDSDIKEQKYSEKFSLVIECKDEIEQEMLYHKLSSEGIKCQVQSL